MPAALQCPDCGHQEMLDNLGGVTTFRCGGCGRALKVPAQLRLDPGARAAAPGTRRPAAGEPTQAMPRVPPGAVPPAATRPTPAVAPPPVPAAGPLVGSAGLPTGRTPSAVAQGPAEPPPRPPSKPTPAQMPPPLPLPPGSLRPPLILRLALWVIALPLGSLFVFALASSLKLLTRLQLENTFVLTGWGRFVPIARLLPFCALAAALIVQLGVFGLERRRARQLRARPSGRRGPGGATRPGPTRPLAPSGGNQRPLNGARSRDRVIS